MAHRQAGEPAVTSIAGDYLFGEFDRKMRNERGCRFSRQADGHDTALTGADSHADAAHIADILSRLGRIESIEPYSRFFDYRLPFRGILPDQVTEFLGSAVSRLVPRDRNCLFEVRRRN
jgi:hypothetical protein